MGSLARAACVAVWLAASTAAVLAQPGPGLTAEPNPEAEKLFRDARRMLKDGQVSAACDAFAASSKLGPSVGTFLNLGDCRAHLGQVASAWAAFVEAGRLATKLGDARRAEADKRAGELEPQLSYLTLDAPRGASGLEIARDGVAIDPAVWGQAIAVDPGTYRITARAPGFDAWTTTIAVGAAANRQIVHIPPLHPRPIPSLAVAPRFTLTPTRDAALASAGAGVLAGGAALVFALQAKSLDDEARTACPAGQPCHDLAATQTSQRAVSRARVATIVGAAGGAAIVAGVALWFVGRPRNAETPRVTAAATRDSLSLALVGTFR